jgi:hypothetical protein
MHQIFVRLPLLHLVALGGLLMALSNANAESVAAFLKNCSASKDKSACYAEIDSGTDQLLLKGDKRFCPPDWAKLSNTEVAENWAAILKWLTAHSGGKDASLEIADAWRARYPCSKQ